MYFLPVAKSIARITIDLTGYTPSAGSQAAGLIWKREYANWGLWIRLPRHCHLRMSCRFRHTGLLLSRRRHAHHGSGEGQHTFFRKESSGSDSAQRAFGTAGVFGGPGRIGAPGPGDFSRRRFRRRDWKNLYSAWRARLAASRCCRLSRRFAWVRPQRLKKC